MDVYRKHAILKDVTSEGEVVAVVARLNVVDKDGDYTIPGFFGSQPTVIVRSHDWSDVMLGKGVVTDENGQEALFHGRINLDDPDGAALHAKLRFDLDHPPPLVEWSYGFLIRPGAAKRDTIDGTQVRVLGPAPDGGPGAKVAEVSPVLRGAGEGTRTVAVKSAIASHSTDTTDRPWDGTAVVAALPNDPDVLRYVHAWRDDNGDPTAKSSYKFPHHHGDGGPANVRAARAIIAILNGARGGADIPDADRQGVYRHAARHLRDAGVDVPELRDGPPPAVKFADQVTLVLDAVEATIERARAIKQLRADEGKDIGETSRRHLERLAHDLKEAGVAVADLLAPPTVHDPSLVAEFARWQAIVTHLTAPKE